MTKRKLLVAVLLAALASLGTAVALAGVHTQTPKATAPAATQVSGAQPADTDGVQQGDQNAPDTAAEAGGAEEKAAAEEPQDANLPGGGHADPGGADVQHDFQGVE